MRRAWGLVFTVGSGLSACAESAVPGTSGPRANGDAGRTESSSAEARLPGTPANESFIDGGSATPSALGSAAVSEPMPRNEADVSAAGGDAATPIASQGTVHSSPAISETAMVATSNSGLQTDPAPGCGDGKVGPAETCDDGNVSEGDGCSALCRVEFGKKCEGEPSVCTLTQCGDGRVEGVEACDDGNTASFDGCSSICRREPVCSGSDCVSRCGDGVVLNEECDDANSKDGDGCSHDCKLEPGFHCAEEQNCEKVNGRCVLRVPVVFRDFPNTHSDFDVDCDGLVTGIVHNQVNAAGRPVLSNGSKSCVKDEQSFAQWYTDGDWNVRVNSSLLLFDNGKGGFVNRYHENGDPWVATVDPKDPNIASQVPASGMGEQSLNGTCDKGCAERVRNTLQCDNSCRPQHDAIRGATDVLSQLEYQIEQLGALSGEPPSSEALAQLDLARAKIDAATQNANQCDQACETQFNALAAACVADCKPCSFDKTKNCTGGIVMSFDGNPLFFPVDGVIGKTANSTAAKIPEQYGYPWPEERQIFPDAPNHNFFFTTEVQHWFRYEATTNAALEFSGDDDVWVFINGKLAVDLGGLHVPETGSVTINAQTATKFELVAGNLYPISVFHAERKEAGSSFRLTLTGLSPTPSVCVRE